MADEIRNQLLRFKSAFSEFYEILRTVEIAYGDRLHRIEIVRVSSIEQDFYAANFWVDEGLVFVPPSDSEPPTKVGNGFVRDPNMASASIHESTPEAAFAQAINLLIEAGNFPDTLKNFDN